MEFPPGKVKDTGIYPSRDTQHVYTAECEQQRRSRNPWCKVLTKQKGQQTHPHTEGKWSVFVPCLQNLPRVFDTSKPLLLTHPSMGSSSRAQELLQRHYDPNDVFCPNHSKCGSSLQNRGSQENHPDPFGLRPVLCTTTPRRSPQDFLAGDHQVMLSDISERHQQEPAPIPIT